MDSENTINCSKIFSVKRIVALIISIINLIIFCILFYCAWGNVKDTPNDNLQLIIGLNMTLCLLVFASNIRLIKGVWTGKMSDIRYCLEYFIILFVLNIIPMISKHQRDETNIKFRCFDISEKEKMCYWEKENSLEKYYDFISLSSKLFYVMIALEMYFVYLYYNYELTFPQQNVSYAPPLGGNPSAPTEQCQMAFSHDIAHQTHQYMSQPARLNAIRQPGQNVFCQPVTSTSNLPHSANVFTSSSMITKPSQADI